MALSRDMRLSVAMSVLSATGQLDDLRAVIGEAIDHGMKPAQLREILLQVYLFAGYPRAINGMAALNEVLTERSMDLDDSIWIETAATSQATLNLWAERGEALCRIIYGDDYDKLIENMAKLHPEFADWIVREGYGKVLSRSSLPALQREFCVIGILAVFELDLQLVSHILGTIRVGGRWEDMEEAILLATSYVPESRPRIVALDTMERAREKMLADSPT